MDPQKASSIAGDRGVHLSIWYQTRLTLRPDQRKRGCTRLRLLRLDWLAIRGYDSCSMMHHPNLVGRLEFLRMDSPYHTYVI